MIDLGMQTNANGLLFSQTCKYGGQRSNEHFACNNVVLVENFGEPYSLILTMCPRKWR